MTTLKVTAKGQVTLKKEVLRHLGVKPGDRVLLDLIPGGNAAIRAEPKEDTIDSFIGLLHDPKAKPLDIEEMNAIIAEGWARRK